MNARTLKRARNRRATFAASRGIGRNAAVSAIGWPTDGQVDGAGHHHAQNARMASGGPLWAKSRIQEVFEGKQ